MEAMWLILRERKSLFHFEQPWLTQQNVRSSDGCYGYIILLKLRRYSAQNQPKRIKDETAKAPPQLRGISALNVLSDNISSRDGDWCRMQIRVLLLIQSAIPP